MGGRVGGNGAAASAPSHQCANQPHGLGWKTSFLPKAVLLSGGSAAASLQIDVCLHGPGVTGSRELGFSAVCKLHAINFSGAAPAGDARLRRAGEEEAFCSRAAVAGAGPGCPAPAAPPEDNEPLLEAAVSLPRGGMSPRMSQVRGAARYHHPTAGSQPGVVLGCIFMATFASFPGAQDAPGCFGAAQPLASTPDSTGHQPLRLCATSPSPRSQGRAQRVVGRHIRSPRATKQRVSPYHRRQPQLNHRPDIPRTKDPFSSVFAMRVPQAPTRRLLELPP